MKKPDSLRRALTDSVRYLRDNPDNLHVFVDDGRAISTGVPCRGWEYQYTLNIVVTDYSGDQNLLMAAIQEWLSVNQPDVMANPDKREKAVRFQVDILNHTTCDISYYLDLTERVIVSVNGDVATVTAIDEPESPEWQDNYWLKHHG